MIDEDTKVKMINSIAKADVTLSLLFLKFGDAVIKLQDALEYTSFKTISEANRAAKEGRLEIPTFRFTDSQKAERFVSIHDLAAHIDAKREDAEQFNGLMSGTARSRIKSKANTKAPNRRTSRKDHTLSA